MILDLTPAEIVRFQSHLRLAGCGVKWSGELNRYGYGRFTIYRDGERIRILAHRLAYKLATGEDPGEQVVRHQCDTPPCCTPDCFLLGTQAQNIQDAISRGRLNTTGLSQFRESHSALAEARIAVGMKTCPRCLNVKPFADFAISTRSVDGRAYRCKACTAEHRASRKAAA